MRRKEAARAAVRPRVTMPTAEQVAAHHERMLQQVENDEGVKAWVERRRLTMRRVVLEDGRVGIEIVELDD